MFFRKFGRVARRVGLVAVVALTMLGVLLPGVAQAAPAAGTVERPAYSGYYYTVRPGDTLSGIARYNGTTVQAIMSANGLYSTVIFVGQVLYIPAGSGGRWWRWWILRSDLRRAPRRHAFGHCTLVRGEYFSAGSSQRHLELQPHLCGAAPVHSVWLQAAAAAARAQAAAARASAATMGGMWPVLLCAARR